MTGEQMVEAAGEAVEVVGDVVMGVVVGQRLVGVAGLVLAGVGVTAVVGQSGPPPWLDPARFRQFFPVPPRPQAWRRAPGVRVPSGPCRATLAQHRPRPTGCS